MAFEDRSNFWAKRLRRRSLLQAGMAGGAVLALAACGTKTKSSSSGSQTSTAANQPKSGGTLAMPITADPYDWDPTYNGPGLPNSYAFHMAYNSVLTWQHTPDLQYGEMKLQPELATSWEVPDAQTFIFHLRNGVTFANMAPTNGRPMTADDVKFSFEYSARLGTDALQKLPISQYGSYFEGMNAIETPDASTVKVTFKDPFVPFVNYMASSFVPVMPHEIYDKDGHFKDQIVGTGPFQLDKASSQPGGTWVWKKNPSYWDKGRPYIDQINWITIKDDASALAAFQTKQLDILSTNLDQTSVDTLTKEMPQAVLYQQNDVAPMHLYMSLKNGSPLTDLRLRQAVSLAMNRDEFLQTLYKGKGAWAMAGAMPDTFTQDEIKSLLKQDPQQAKQLVAAAGHPNGIDLQFNYPGNAYGQIYITQMQLLQSQLKQAGINLQLNSLDKDTESTRKKAGQFTMEDTPKSMDGDVDSYVYNVFYPNLRTNYTGVDDPGLTPLLVQQRQETDAQKRNDIVRQAVKRINVDQVWALAVYDGLYWNIWQPRLKNYAPHFAIEPTYDICWLSE